MYYPPLSKVVQELDVMFRSTRLVELKSIADDAERVGRTITKEGYGSVKAPRTATEEERQAAEAEAERADAATDAPDIRGAATRVTGER